MENSNGTATTSEKNETKQSSQETKKPYTQRGSITFELDVYKNDELKEKMTQLLSVEGNEQCAECGSKEPEWASASLGVILCIVCSGIHRNLGVHISRVKSLFLDNWKKDELEFMRENGNIKSYSVWEAHTPKCFVKPSATDSLPLKEQFIRAKYERKEYSQPQQSTTENELLAKEGFLTKKGIVVKNWKKRWFSLSGTLLSYYKKQKDPFPAGVIAFKDATGIDCVTEPIDNKQFCFAVKTPSREYFICADNAKDMYDWVQTLRRAKACLSDRTTGKKASEIDIKDIVPKISSGISIQKRKLNKKTFPNCFIGAAAVDWMMLNLNMSSRSECVAVGKKLLDEGFIQSVTSEPFADTFSLYQFLKTQ